MHLDRRLLGWGIFFILLGGIPLAAKAGLLDPQLLRQWPLLWPVLLIGWGLGLLLRGTPLAMIGGAVSAITFGIMGGSALVTGFGGVPFASGCSSNSPVVAFPARTGTFGPSASVEVVLSCGALRIGSAEGNGWSVEGADRDGAGPTLRTGNDLLSISSHDGRGPFDAGGRSEWNVVLPRTPVLALGVTVNAGQGNVELEGHYSSVNLTVNAGEAHLLLGGVDELSGVNATVNAGSAVIAIPVIAGASNLSLNAGSMELCLAPGTPLRITWQGALGSNDLDDAGLVKVDDRTWTSAGLDAAQPHLDVHVTANAGSFSLDIDGTCDA